MRCEVFVVALSVLLAGCPGESDVAAPKGVAKPTKVELAKPKLKPLEVKDDASFMARSGLASELLLLPMMSVGDDLIAGPGGRLLQAVTLMSGKIRLELLSVDMAAKKFEQGGKYMSSLKWSKGISVSADLSRILFSSKDDGVAVVELASDGSFAELIHFKDARSGQLLPDGQRAVLARKSPQGGFKNDLVLVALPGLRSEGASALPFATPAG